MLKIILIIVPYKLKKTIEFILTEFQNALGIILMLQKILKML